MGKYDYRPFKAYLSSEQDEAEQVHPVVIIGAGPVGLSMAIDLATHGIRSVVLDDNNVVSIGSRAICWAKRTLEIFGRLGVGDKMLEKGITWQTGRLFHGEHEVFSFDLLPETGHKYPAFINLQQYYVEQYLVERALEFRELIDLRFKNKVVSHSDFGNHVSVTVETPSGSYTMDCSYLLACDGAGSPTRNRMGLAFDGQTFDEHFLIVDVEMETSPFSTNEAERWFWFEPSFHPGQSALLHKQPDNIYRIDLQLGPDSDPMLESTKEKALPRIKAIVGDKPFEIDWMSVYKFRCAKLDQFVHNRVLFVGDSAHVVSPFGARGGNGGIQDVDNLGWKLAAVLNGKASEKLLLTYQQERGFGAKENISNSSRATNFMTPKSPIEHQFRNEVLRLAQAQPFARKLINSGRLSVPCSLEKFMPECKEDGERASGSVVIDAPLESNQWLIEKMQGRFLLVGFGEVNIPVVQGVQRLGIGQQDKPYPCIGVPNDIALERYGESVVYLIRPDGHIVASFNECTSGDIIKVLDTIFKTEREV